MAFWKCWEFSVREHQTHFATIAKLHHFQVPCTEVVINLKCVGVGEQMPLERAGSSNNGTNVSLSHSSYPGKLVWRSAIKQADMHSRSASKPGYLKATMAESWSRTGRPVLSFPLRMPRHTDCLIQMCLELGGTKSASGCGVLNSFSAC